MLRRNLLAAFGSVSLLTVVASSPALALQLGQSSEPEAPSSSMPKLATLDFDPTKVYDNDLVIGFDTAPVTIIEYASLTCPHCANFHNNVYPELKKALIDTGKARFIYRHFPLDQLAAAGAVAIACLPVENQPASISGLFKSLMAETSWTTATSFDTGIGKVFTETAGAAYKPADVTACISDETRFRAALQPAFEAQQAEVVTGTPFFFINGKVFEKPRTVEEFTKAVAEATDVAPKP